MRDLIMKEKLLSVENCIPLNDAINTMNVDDKCGKIVSMMMKIKSIHEGYEEYVYNGLYGIYNPSLVLPNDAWEIVQVFRKNLLLYFICKKAVEDNFDLSEYVLKEIPLENEMGEIWCFANNVDSKLVTAVIDFFVNYDGFVSPMYLGFNKETCQEALSRENES